MKGLASFPLGIQAVEVLFETFFSGFARINGAADVRWALGGLRVSKTLK